MLYPQEFHDFFKQLEEIANKIPKGEDPGWRRDLDNLFEMVRKLLERTHFSVGFLAASQSGKSTTVNNIVGFALLPEGKSATCSSVRVRIRRSKDGQWSRIFSYYSQSGIKAWRDLICKDLDLFNGSEPEGYDDQAVLDKISEKRKLNLTISEKDALNYIERLLKSKKDFPKKLEIQSIADRKSFRTRDELSKDLKTAAQHPPEREGISSSEHALIEEIVVEIPSRVIHESLELIDLPGLGTTNKQDIVGTTRFLKELDAAFLLAKATDNLSRNPVFEQFLESWRKSRANFSDSSEVSQKIWLTLTYFGSLPHHNVLESPNVFDTIQELAHRLKLGEDRFVFIDNEFHKTRDKDETRNAKFCHHRIAENGDVDLAEHLATHRFAPAFREIFADGGISTIKDRIENQLYTVIRKQQTAALSKELLRIAETLKYRVETLIRSSSKKIKSLKDRNLWLSQVHQLLGSISGKNRNQKELVDLLTKHVNEHVNELLEIVSLATSHMSDGTESLEKNYLRVVESLSGCSDNLCFHKENGFFCKVRKAIGESLDEFARNRGLVSGADSPAQEFLADAMARFNISEDKLRKPLQALAGFRIPGKQADAQITVDEYTVIMYRIAYQLVFEMHQQMNELFGAVLRELQESIGKRKADDSKGSAFGDSHAPSWNEYKTGLENIVSGVKRAESNQDDATFSAPDVGDMSGPIFDDDEAFRRFNANDSVEPEELMDLDNDPNNSRW